VVTAISGQNVILPSGTMKIGQFEYQVAMNASPPTIQELNAIPIKSMSNGTTIVSASIQGVIREAIIAACLTALMILLFLSSWRELHLVPVSLAPSAGRTVYLRVPRVETLG
jgi:multidrug efflux pump subunit AcrB